MTLDPRSANPAAHRQETNLERRRAMAVLRSALLGARAELRTAEHTLEYETAFEETTYIRDVLGKGDAAVGTKALGANEADRKRALLIFAFENPHLAERRAARDKLLDIIAKFDNDLTKLTDERRDLEWEIRERMVGTVEEESSLTVDSLGAKVSERPREG